PINPATVTPEAFSLVSAGSAIGGARLKAGEIQGSLAYNAEKSMITFTPDEDLDTNSTYTGTVTTRIKDMMGNALQTPYIWSFRTGESNSPTVVSTEPDNDATNVFLNTKVIANFSTAMDGSSI